MKTVTKSIQVNIPQSLYDELFILFDGDDIIISKWLHTPKPFLNNKAPLELLDKELGLKSILDLIHRLKTGDLS